MKQILLIGFIVSIYVKGVAQELGFPLKDGRVHYELVDSGFGGRAGAELYCMSKLWLLDELTGMRHELEIDRPEAGLIAGKIRLPYEVMLSGQAYSCSCSFAVVSKDGRFKAQLYNFMLSYNAGEYEESKPLECYLDPTAIVRDNKKKLPYLAGQIYSVLRGLQVKMEAVDEWMDF